MIGSGLKKLAKEKGMKVASGVAYGSLDGYAATMQEGSGWKRVTLTTKFTDVQKQNELLALCNSKNLQKEYRVQNLQFSTDGIDIVFRDTVGTMKKLTAFLDWFMPLLPQHGALGVNYCPQCGMEITGGCWKLVNGVASHMHEACAEKLVRDIRSEEQEQKENASGSYVSGLIGALLGSALGSIVWAIVLSLDYVASIVGLLIGFLADKGYDLLKGKQGKAKVWILILATLAGVVLGTLGGYGIVMGQMITAGELPGYVFADIPMLLTDMIRYSPEFTGALVSNIGLGVLFAGLGIFGLLRKTNREVSDTKIIDLN